VKRHLPNQTTQHTNAYPRRLNTPRRPKSGYDSHADKEASSDYMAHGQQAIIPASREHMGTLLEPKDSEDVDAAPEQGRDGR